WRCWSRGARRPHPHHAEGARHREKNDPRARRAQIPTAKALPTPRLRSRRGALLPWRARYKYGSDAKKQEDQPYPETDRSTTRTTILSSFRWGTRRAKAR